MHQTVGNVLRVLMRPKNLTPQQQPEQIMDNTFATAIYGTMINICRKLRMVYYIVV